VILVAAPMTRAAPTPEGASADAALLSEYAHGNAEALGELFDRHHRATYRFLARLTGANHADLDDLVQVTFVQVARSASRFDGRAMVRTWLFGIAINVARHHVRGNVRRRKVIADPDDDEQPSRIPGHDRPDETAENRELLLHLERAIDELPHKLREVFVACEVEDLPGPDVARLLRIPEGTLWRRLHEARKAIRAALGESP
jgi:RNA polymerase sigma-70 factor (ECF subfamily)